MAVRKTQLDFFDYDAFEKKFEAKKTTDDCYTPEPVYECVKSWACERYGIDPDSIVRPFWPNADYTRFDYPEGCVVLDNPPFSIISEITHWYINEGIAFFLFCPKLACFSGKHAMRANHVFIDENIVYENGAQVPTAFVTSYGGHVVETAPDLQRSLKELQKRERAKKRKELPKYDYPDHIVTAAMIARYAKYGVEYTLDAKDCCFVTALDSQKAAGKSIFGNGFLLTHTAAAERAAAERAAAERAAAERAAAKKWKLSERELKIIDMMEETR